MAATATAVAPHNGNDGHDDGHPTIRSFLLLIFYLFISFEKQQQRRVWRRRRPLTVVLLFIVH
jgi:hypothetical protein